MDRPLVLGNQPRWGYFTLIQVRLFRARSAGDRADEKDAYDSTGTPIDEGSDMLPIASSGVAELASRTFVLRVTASSNLLPGHPAWQRLPAGIRLEFGDFADWPKALRAGGDDRPLAFVLFLEDIIDPASVDSVRLDGAALVPQLAMILESIDAALARDGHQPLIVSWSVPSPGSPILNARHRSTWTQVGRALEAALYARAETCQNLYLLPLDRELARIGTNVAFDARNFFAARCRLSSAGLDQLVRALGLVLSRILQPARKALVLDCDNTLWGGVVGEDGVSGLRLGSDGSGAAYASFQREILALARTGTLLALASKNDASDVWNVFDTHPSMHLSRADITAARISYRPKFEGVQELAAELGLGLDSFVFWDDNPLERAEMRLQCPEVYTPEPPTHVEDWPHAIGDLAVFDRFSVTAEDRDKSAQYAARAQFQALQRKTLDEGQFLTQLQLRPRKVAIDAASFDRAMQLVTKTNQFNLRGVRHTPAHLEQMLAEPRCVAFLVHLHDQFGDHGLVALVVCRPTQDHGTAFLDSLMISCRVLGRRLEAWILARAASELRAKEFGRLLAEYRPLPRNGMVGDLLPTMGFSALSREDGAAAAAGVDSADAGQLFIVDLADFSPPYQDVFADDSTRPDARAA